jgi:hypothetical protein
MDQQYIQLASTLPSELLTQEMWARGDLEFLTFVRPHGQNSLYRFIDLYKQENPDCNIPIIFNCHRRLGKSYLLLLKLIERCIQRPGTQALYIAPFYTQLSEFVRPNFNIITQTIPPSLKPRKSRNKYYFHNPKWPRGSLESELRLTGVHPDPERLRGPGCDIAAIDEARDIKCLSYVIEEILSYMFAGKVDPTILMATTPPPSIAHEFITKWVPQSIAAGAYKVIPVSQNPDFTKKDEKCILDIVKSKQSIGWQREAECKFIDDPELRVLSNFTDANVQSFEPLEYYRPLTCVDFGYYPDYTAILFGYVDYLNKILFVIDEVVVREKSTGEIMRLAKAKEDKWFKNNRLQVRRFGDNSMQQLADLAKDYGFYVDATDKWDRDKWIAELNFRCQQGRIIIHPRCEKAILQCKHASWDRKKSDGEVKKEFIRNEEVGHCDAVACLVYMSRMAPWDENTLPDKAYNIDKQWVDRMVAKSSDQKIVEVFRPKVKR